MLTGPSGLFSRRDLERISEHIDDGCKGAEFLKRFNPLTVIDVGSGGGVPGFQIAIELNKATTHLVEAQRWKARFLTDCAMSLNLNQRVCVHNSRAEDLAKDKQYREFFCIGTARAVADPVVVAEYLAPLVRVGGRLVLWSTTKSVKQAELKAIPLLGLAEPTFHQAVSLLREDGALIEWRKVGPCDPRYPRRSGVAVRRPLGK